MTVPLEQERLKRGETTIAVKLVRVENPDHAQFTVEVMLAACDEEKAAHSEPVGALGLYPAGESGGSYAFDVGPGLKRMLAAGYVTKQICIKLQLKGLRASVPLPETLRVTITRPEWKEPR